MMMREAPRRSAQWCSFLDNGIIEGKWGEKGGFWREKGVLWNRNQEWDSVAPDRILLDTQQPTQQWELRDTRTKRTFLMLQFVLAL